MTFGDLTTFPYEQVDNSELKCINEKDRINIGNEQITSPLDHIKRAPKLCDIDNGVNLSNLTDCDYYTIEEFQNININNNFNVFHCNVNGLESKYDHIHEFFSTTNSEIDLIAFTETSLQSNNEFFLKNVTFDGFNQFSTPTNSGKGGATIYVKSKYDIVPRMDLEVRNDHFESTWIELKNKKGKNIICASIYRHPHDNSKIFSDFLEYLEKVTLKITKENKEIFICGDFNCDLLKVNVSSIYDKFYDLLSSYGLFPSILLPTRVGNSSSTIIDNIFTNNLDKEVLSGVIKTDFSDHFSQFISIKRGKIDLKKPNIFTRDYSSFSAESFRDDVSIQVYNTELIDVNDAFNDFYFKLEGAVERHAPMKKLKRKDIKMKQKPWITNELKKMIKIKNKYHNRRKRQPNNENVKKIYNLFRNRVNRELDKAKKRYYASYFNEN